MGLLSVQVRHQDRRVVAVADAIAIEDSGDDSR
jgi:hypothetical protein